MNALTVVAGVEQLRFDPAALHAARLACGWSQERLGVVAGVGSGMIGKWERGENEPLASAAARIAHALGRPMESLFTDRPAVPPQDAG